MKIKEGFLLRKLDQEYLAVAVGEAGKNFNGVIRMNETGAWCWNQMLEEISKQALIDRMCENFDDLDPATAEADLEELLRVLAIAIEP